jgi:putative redox protein
VLSGLVACTAITLRMYSLRKGLNLVGVRVETTLVKRGDTAYIDRRLWLQGDLTPDQEAGLLAIAERTPVTLTLKNGLEIRTELQSDGDSMQP